MSRQGKLIRFENADYAQMRERQRQTVELVADAQTPETLFLGTHPHVITLGRRTDRQNLLPTPAGLTTPQVFEIERGGDVTYHGPGQLVGYPILNLSEKRDLHAYLRDLEEVQIRALAQLGIRAGRKKDYTGVWVGDGERKIASIGIAVRRWVTYHGFALNVATDLRYFGMLNPCGLDASVMTSVSQELQQPIGVAALTEPLLNSFNDVMGIRFTA